MSHLIHLFVRSEPCGVGEGGDVTSVSGLFVLLFTEDNSLGLRMKLKNQTLPHRARVMDKNPNI